MGAWIALRMARELVMSGEGDRVAGMLLLAPAPDFTVDLVEPDMTDEQRLEVVARGYFETPSEYSGEPNVFTEALLRDGHANRVLTGPIDTSFPVTIIQGMLDPDVPVAHARKLADLLPPDRVKLSLVPDGDHRLSRPQDIEAILASLDSLLARTGAE
jgi:pimeloyl-ACP methyl ester carboxylesterase